MPYRGPRRGLDGGVQLLRRHRMREKNPHGAVGETEERDRELLASARIARQETLRGVRNAVENVGGLPRRARAAFFRRVIEEVVAPVGEQKDAAGVIRSRSISAMP